MNAGRLLRETGYDSDMLRSRIAPIDPDRVNVWPASSLVRRFWRAGIKGVTQWRWVLVDPDTLRGDPDLLARLVIHELVHLRQFRDLGFLRFMSRYVYQYWAGRLRGGSARQAYLDIEAEREARETTTEVVTATRG
ncbi:MAG TPA: hypothetical protein VG872_07670 [Acidimicrobiia bacterium]|nr:hypothetical protein [Acidimicrobiia bacterium]